LEVGGRFEGRVDCPEDATGGRQFGDVDDLWEGVVSMVIKKKHFPVGVQNDLRQD